MSAPADAGERLDCRVLVHLDYVFHRRDGAVYTDRAFILFVAAMARHVRSLTVAGRLVETGEPRYRLPPEVGFAGLASYESLARPADVARALRGALASFWRALDDADVVWLLGPHPFSFAFALLAAMRRRPVVIGVRQDLRQYTRRRHPGRRALILAADLMEGAWRAIGRLRPAVVVGPQLAERYGRGRAVHEAAISLVSAADIVERDPAAPDPGEELEILSVGRLDEEKNPLLLADIGAELETAGRPWRLRVCGDGPLAGELEARARELGVEGRVELLGYVPWERLRDLYRSSDVFLHVSLTEGLPQVLHEAFAASLPTVATDVGGVRAASEGAALLVPPADAPAAAAAVLALAGDAGLRARLAAAGRERVRATTIEAETRRVAEFAARAARSRGSAPSR